MAALELALTLQSNMVLSTTNQHLVVTADDVDLQALSLVSSGSGAIEVYAGSQDQEVGIGQTVKPLHIDDAELALFATTSSLTVGDSSNGDIVVDGVTAANTAAIGVLSLTATKGGKTVQFANNPSEFGQGLSVAAAGGVLGSPPPSTDYRGARRRCSRLQVG